jgi:hypothetical protein
MVGEGVPRRQRQGQRNHDAHASAAAVSGFNSELAAERLNAFLHAAKPETRRLVGRDAEAVVTHRQFEMGAFTAPRLRGEVGALLRAG